ncbi:MAG: hypothetical protein MUP41_13740, partial [Desulfobacterales bacterium]|nr:hypothetical protein [Desulfobacterales bacterium]
MPRTLALLRYGACSGDIGGRPDNEVLFRAHSIYPPIISRGFEEECLRFRIPYQIIGGFRFYERKEIKDILCYLKVFLN